MSSTPQEVSPSFIQIDSLVRYQGKRIKPWSMIDLGDHLPNFIIIEYDDDDNDDDGV